MKVIMNIIKCDLCKSNIDIFNQDHILDKLFLCNECQDKINKLNPDIQQRFKKLTNDIIELQLSKNR